MHRTYVRRRIAVLATALALVGALSGPVARALSPTDRFDLISMRTHVVRDGETLWSIASVTAPGSDPRVTIDEIRRLNPRASSRVLPGQILILPSRN